MKAIHIILMQACFIYSMRSMELSPQASGFESFIAHGKDQQKAGNLTLAADSFTNAARIAKENSDICTAQILLGKVYEEMARSDALNKDLHAINAQNCYRTAANTGLVEGLLESGRFLTALIKKDNLKDCRNYLANPHNPNGLEKIQAINNAHDHLWDVTQHNSATLEQRAIAYFNIGHLHLCIDERETAKISFTEAAKLGHYASIHNCALFALEENQTDTALELLKSTAQHHKPSARTLARVTKELSTPKTASNLANNLRNRTLILINGVMEDSKDMDQETY